MNNSQIKKEIDELLKDKGRLFGLLYPYILVVGVAIGIYFVSNINEIGRQNIPHRLAADSTGAAVDLKITEARSIPPVDVNTIAEPTEQLINTGRETYQKLCASCHGEDGAGTGPAAAGLNPAPRNFTVSENWKNGSSLTGIFTTLQEGIPNSAMVPYDYLMTEEKFALAHYIRNEFAKNAPKDTEDDLAALDQTYNLSAGKEVPAQIPVSAAMDLLFRENREQISRFEEINNSIRSDKSAGAELFRRNVNNPVQVLYILQNSESWRSGQPAFNRILNSNTGYLGFNTGVKNLSAEDLKTLYEYLQSKI